MVRGGGAGEPLRAQESRLLRWLVLHEGQTWDRATVLREVWGYGPKVVSRTLDTTLSRLRSKIEEDPRNPRYLRTIAGEGLRLERAAPRGEVLGRARERAALAVALEAGALVTLVGLGGAGKTLLAKDVAAARFGVFCDVSAAQGAADLIRMVGEALLGAWTGPATDGALLDAILAVRPTLLVVDNVEQVVGPAADLLERVRAAAPEQKVLVTSRLPLGLRGEEVISIAGLDPDAAVALYSRCVGAPPPERAPLEAVLDQVDRLPLAIELVAAWSDVLPLSALRERLASGPALLVTEDRDRPDRHHSIARVLEDAIAHLAPADQSALRRLSLCSAGLTLPDAEALLGPRAALHLRRLGQRSLVSQTAPGTFAVRALVRSHLQAAGVSVEDGLALARRVAAPGCTLARRAPQDALRAAGLAVDADALELAAACATAAAETPGVDVDACTRLLNALTVRLPPDAAGAAQLTCARLLYRAGRGLEAGRALEPLLDAPPHLGVPAAEVLLLAGAVRRDAGDPEGALSCFERAEEAATGPVLRGRARAEQAFVLGRLGAAERGLAAAEEGVASLREGADRRALAAALRTLAGLRRETGAANAGLLEEAEGLYAELGDRRAQAVLSGARALRRMDAGDLDAAASGLDEAILLLRGCGAGHLAAVYQANRAFVERLLGRPGAARVAYADALVALRVRGDRVHEALVLGNLGELSLEDGALQEGERLLREAVDRSAAVGFSKLEGLFLASLGLARTLLGDAASGAADLARSEEILHAGRFEDALCCARATRARAATARGDFDAARSHLAAARRISPGIPWVDAFWRRAEGELDAALARSPQG